MFARRLLSTGSTRQSHSLSVADGLLVTAGYFDVRDWRVLPNGGGLTTDQSHGKGAYL